MANLNNIFDAIATKQGFRTTDNERAYSLFRQSHYSAFADEFNALLGGGTDYDKAAREYVSKGAEGKSPGEALHTAFNKFSDKYRLGDLPGSDTSVKNVGKGVLRQRFFDMPEPQPPHPQREVANAVSADLFGFVPSNEELGENNTLFLHNRLNEHIRYDDSNVRPLRTDGPEILGFDSFIPLRILRDDIEQVGEDHLLQGMLDDEGPVCVAIQKSNLDTLDTYTNTMRHGFLEAESRREPFRLDTNAPLPFMSNNVIGFTVDSDMWRYPMTRGVKSEAVLPVWTQLAMINSLGPQLY